MAFLVTRLKSGDDFQPDHDAFPYGITAYENTPKKAIESYGRRVLGGADRVQEGDKFILEPLGDQLDLTVTKRTVSIKVEETTYE